MVTYGVRSLLQRIGEIQDLPNIVESAFANVSNTAFQVVLLDVLKALVHLGQVELDSDFRRLCSHVHCKHLVISVCRILQRAQATVGWLENKLLQHTDTPSVITEVVQLILSVVHRDWTTDT